MSKVDYSQINEDYLKNIDYKNLKSEFEKLGLISIWKDGDNKPKLIKSALGLIAKINKDNAEKDAEKAKEDLEKLAEKEAKEQKAKEEKEQKDLVAKKYPKEVIEKNLEIIKANLRNNIPAQRDMLLKKKVQLEKLLENDE